MLERVSTRPGVVPLESFIDVSCATYVVSRWIAVASENIDKSGADALHKDRSGIFRASENHQEF
jgi:hypothetical protein